ncbi:DUF3857 domain-containing protein [Dysgonomonas sp. 25]|uniref:DUF3857 domain-containing protein n=1 Tax=Dysgonomonas sp. 25 TaxID=2302933 RepID=UPI0013D02637|nr:DUF3857 domain-containing protein [Dysgonomonas sp. 25]NDV70350.1 DUF3857 domain-containing protein [Dysgonomonas sp. 25]
MKKLFLLLIMTCCVASLYSQSKYGKITMEELEMDSYPADSTASAVILSKVGKTEFRMDRIMGFVYEYTLEMKIKILKHDGLEYCTKEIFYNEYSRKEQESIKALSGTTYNLVNGKIEKTKLSKEFIFDEEHDETTKIKKFTMPAAKVGSVIEYKYTFVSPFDYNLPTFEFQSEIPIKYVYYEVLIPEYYTYNISMQGYERVETSDKNKNIRFHLEFEDTDGRYASFQDDCMARELIFKKTDMPALRHEPYMWSRKDYVSKVGFELRNFQFKYGKMTQYSSSWEKVDERILAQKSFGGNLNKESLFKKEVKEGDLTISNATAILGMIRERVKWNKESGVSTKNMNNALKTGLGSSADMNFLLINALSAAGFDAFPVVLSTRRNGLIPMVHPTISSYNYMISGVMIDGKLCFVDASDVFSIWNVLPEKAMVFQGRIIKKGASKWVDLSGLTKGTSYWSSTLKFEDGKLKADVNNSERATGAYRFRSFYYNNHSDQDDFVETLSKNFGLEIKDFKISNEQNLGEDVKVSFSTEMDVELGDEYLYITPMFIKHRTANPFTDETRLYPVNFDYLTTYVQNVILYIPEGYVVEELPKSEKIIFDEEQNISLSYRTTQEENKIQLLYQYQLKTLFVGQDQYPVLREFFAKLVAKNSEQIVLKKVE